MTTFDVAYEQAEDGSWSASAATLPVFAVGDTREEAERDIRSAIAFHLDGLERAGMPAPRNVSAVGTVTV